MLLHSIKTVVSHFKHLTVFTWEKKTSRSQRHLTYWRLIYFFAYISAIMDPSIRPLRLNSLQSMSLSNGAWKDRRVSIKTLRAATTRHCHNAKTVETQYTYHMCLPSSQRGIIIWLGLKKTAKNTRIDLTTECRRPCTNSPVTPYSLWGRLLVNNKHLMTGPAGNSKFCFPGTLGKQQHWGREETKLTVSRLASH